ncbi:MAG: hypothetical protein GXP31_13740 [Kiritimatiellaeota bacterium]|nr:hypothetical protein [Kiritimatiellota bacterium]
MWVQAIVGCLLVAVGMMISVGLVRLAANLVVVLIGVGACGFVLFQITSGEWTAWPDVLLRSLGCGVIAALLSLPALPFSRFRRR